MKRGVSGKGARRVALDILNRVVGGRAYADVLLERHLTGLPEPDRALTTEIVYGVLRWYIRIDWIIDAFSRITTKRLEHRVLNALRIGVYQLLFLSRIPPSVAIFETVEVIKPYGTKKAGFVNALLRRIATGMDGVRYPDLEKEPVRHISVVYSHPEWMVRRWLGRFDTEETIGLCRANLTPPPRTIRVNTLVVSRKRLVEELQKEGFTVRETTYSPYGIEVSGGLRPLLPFDPRYYIQDEASQLVVVLLSPRADETILDACAAPGGKTIHIVQMMGGKGSVWAFDVHRSRLREMRRNLERFHITTVRLREVDASDPSVLHKALLCEGGGVVEGGFDGILCDAPCSGMGILRRRPDIKLRRREDDIKGLARLQRRLLTNLAQYVKKGGRLVYSTCSFEPEETVGIVEGFVTERKDFILEDAGTYLPEGCRTLLTSRGYLVTYPHRDGMDGFFMARLKRIG